MAGCINLDFYKDKSVFITGHTGFKGSWLCYILEKAGARVTGYSLTPPTEPNLFTIAGIGSLANSDSVTGNIVNPGNMNSVIGDIRDYASLKRAFDEAQPEIVFHLAAQPIVRDSYKDPAYTYETNVMGTVNILECTRNSDCVRSFLNVTTDKVYMNNDSDHSFTETEELNGYDPYSNSKSCSELVTQTYKRCFFSPGQSAVPSGMHLAVGNTETDLADYRNVETGNSISAYPKYGNPPVPSISTARAGNVIGGGDFANDRIIPDCVRAAIKGEPIIVRNPASIRPFQHVLEPLFAYLMIAQKQYEDPTFAGSYNIGPDISDCITAGEITGLFTKYWGSAATWINRGDNGPHEASFLKLDCTKLKNTFGWKPVWNIETAVEKTVEWYKVWHEGGDIAKCMDAQIRDYIES